MTFDDEFTAALRRDLQGVHVGFDPAGAEAMIRVATQSDPLGERRGYVAPLAAAAAVVVIGGGVATFAATRGHGTATGGGPVAPVTCATTSSSATPTTSASASASEVPPVYTPAVPPTTAYPTPVPTTSPAVPPLPTIGPTGSNAEVPTLTTPVPTPSTPVRATTALVPVATRTVYVPPPPPAAPGSTGPAVPSSAASLPPESAMPAGAPTDVPTPAPSTSPADDPCATSATPTTAATDLPSAVPTATPSPVPTAMPTSYADCDPTMIDPGFSGCITFIASMTTEPGGRSVVQIPNQSRIPADTVYVVTGYQVQNPHGDEGTLIMRNGATTLVSTGLSAGVTPLDPTARFKVSSGDPVQIDVMCKNTTTACTPTVRIAARVDQTPILPIPSSTPVSVGSPTHS